MAHLETRHGDDGVRRLVLNRPDRHNALTTDLLADFADAVRDADGDCRVLVVEGAGESFSSGADVDEDSGVERIDNFQDATRAVRAFSGVVIGKLHGYVVGGGFELALSFDLRYAAHGTTFRLPETELGVTPTNASTRLLPLVVGDGRARELLFTRRDLSATEAEDVGLVAAACDPDELDETVRAAATDIVANTSPDGVELTKEALERAFPVEEVLETESLLNRRSHER
ncbi:enoyl-CoA hydratase/isomerase family protein [Haloplanus sp. GCM10025708]|uniref:enoyl-CoA hydratase/isomerase family protein n=1 Tax=Haloferacaceae TaxID=1644056 RepID=UPI0036062429